MIKLQSVIENTDESQFYSLIALASIYTTANFWLPQDINYFMTFFSDLLELQKESYYSLGENVCSCCILLAYIWFFQNRIVYDCNIVPPTKLSFLRSGTVWTVKSPEVRFNEKPESYKFLFLVYIGVAIFFVTMSICWIETEVA